MGYNIDRALMVAQDFADECLRSTCHNRAISFADMEALFKEWKATTRATVQMPPIGPVRLRRLILSVCRDAAIWGNSHVGLERRQET
jgi:hypothetical protein